MRATFRSVLKLGGHSVCDQLLIAAGDALCLAGRCRGPPQHVPGWIARHVQQLKAKREAIRAKRGRGLLPAQQSLGGNLDALQVLNARHSTASGR